MASSFVEIHKLKMVNDDRVWTISVPTGTNQITTMLCRRCPITLGYLVLPVDLIILNMKEYDIILGMNWLSEHHAFIDCRDKKVIFEILGKKMWIFEGVRTQTPEVVSTKITCLVTESRVE